MVAEFVRRYANRPDLLDDLIRLAATLTSSAGTSPDGEPYEPGMAQRGRQRLLSNLLSPADVQRLVARFHAGVAKRKLAAEFGISESSVKRLLRRHRDKNERQDGAA
jgi:DNA-directed RNA polymerase specialized sigma24 family protein